MDTEVSHVEYVLPGQKYDIRWHKGSYPFVCVVVLSTTKDVRGGETVLTGPSGKTVRIELPSKVRVLTGLK